MVHVEHELHLGRGDKRELAVCGEVGNDILAACTYDNVAVAEHDGMLVSSDANSRLERGECLCEVHEVAGGLAGILFVLNFRNIHLLVFRIGLKINLVDDGLARSSSIVTRQTNLVAGQQVLVVVFGRDLCERVGQDELVHAIAGIKCEVGSALVEEDAELVATLNCAVDHQLLILRDVARGQTDVAELVVVGGRPGEGLRLSVPSGVGVAGVLEGGKHLLALVVVGFQIDVVDDGLARGGTVVAREANLVAGQEVLVVVVGSDLCERVGQDELVHAIAGIEREVRTALVEEDAEPVATLNRAVHDQLLVLRQVATGQTDVAELVVIGGRPCEGPRLSIPRCVGVAGVLKRGMYLLDLCVHIRKAKHAKCHHREQFE